MKKILSILGTISLSNIISTNTIACKKPNKNNKQIEQKFIPQQPPKNSNWKLIPRINDVLQPQKEILNFDKNKYVKEDNRIYIVIYPYLIQKWKIIRVNANEINNIWAWSSKTIIYYWNGNNEPQIPTINLNNVEITDWNEKIES